MCPLFCFCRELFLNQPKKKKSMLLTSLVFPPADLFHNLVFETGSFTHAIKHQKISFCAGKLKWLGFLTDLTEKFFIKLPMQLQRRDKSAFRLFRSFPGVSLDAANTRPTGKSIDSTIDFTHVKVKTDVV